MAAPTADTHAATICVAVAHLTALTETDAVTGSELRACLRDALARADVHPAAVVPPILDVLARRGADSELGRALVRTLIAADGVAVLCLLRQRESMWTRFFQRVVTGAAPHAALAWFTAGWSPDGTHKRGAAAIVRWATSHRHDGAWSCLKWAGQHSQSPVVCASKPATFCELDTAATLQSILQHRPDFITSDALWDELLDVRVGDDTILDKDATFFANQLAVLLDEDVRHRHRSPLWILLGRTLEQQPLTTLMQRTLLCTDDADTLWLLHALAPAIDAATLQGPASSAPRAVLAAAPFVCVKWRSVQQAGLAAAMVRQGGDVLYTLIHDRSQAGVPSAQAALRSIEQLPEQPLREKVSLSSAEETRLALLLEAWLTRRRLVNSSAAELEEHMDARGIKWRRETAGRKRKHKHKKSRHRDDGSSSDGCKRSAAMWRCALDDYAMPMDAQTLGHLLADVEAETGLLSVHIAEARRGG
jgi:hypothetical protein